MEVNMYKNQKRVVASFALVAGIASSVSAVNAFANKMVKAMAYRHHKEDDKPSILETKYKDIKQMTDDGKYIVKETDSYNNINEILNTVFNISSRLKVKLINNKSISLNGYFIDTRTGIKPNDVICIDLSYKEDNSNIVPTKTELDILFEDEWFLVINKPSGISIHPSMLHYSDSF